jgi:glycosyltransferase involved in cell wall biosynthesis
LSESTPSNPETSVIIPCFNGERFVAEAIESALAQARGPVEVVVVDDGSSDGSVGIVERYADGDRVRLIRHGTNRGIAAARNTGVRAARGRYIGFLDQDDLWLENKTARQVPAFERDTNGEVGVVFSAIELRRMDAEGRIQRSAPPPAGIERFGPDELLSRMFLSDFVPTVSTLIRRVCFDDVGYLDESIRGGSDDFDLLVRVATRYRFVYLDEVLAVRRLHEANYTDAEKMTPDALAILDRTVAERPALQAVAPRARSRYLYGLARELHAKKQYTRARRAYLDSLEARSTNWKSVAGLILCSSGKLGDALLATLRPRHDRS